MKAITRERLSEIARLEPMWRKVYRDRPAFEAVRDLLVALDVAEPVIVAFVERCQGCRLGIAPVERPDGWWHIAPAKRYQCGLLPAEIAALARYRALVEPPK